jgi:hypothetical protein
MKKWATASCVYGSAQHLELMNDGWEPFSTLALPGQPSPLTREMSIEIWIFMKREKADEGKLVHER